MRCPHCRRKVHPDDISCLYCGTSLRRKTAQTPPASPRTYPRDVKVRRTEETPASQSSGLRGCLIPIVVTICCISLLPTLYMALRLDTCLPAASQPLLPENAIMLDQMLVNWEGFTLKADCAAVGSDYIELTYTAQNGTKLPICCPDAKATVSGQTVDASMYLELEPGEVCTDTLYVESDLFTAMGICNLTQMDLEFTLEHRDDYTHLYTSHARMMAELTLPEGEPMQDFYCPLYNSPEVSLTIVGYRSDLEYGELALYLVTENHSAQTVSWYTEPAREEADYLWLWEETAPGCTQLTKASLYGLPLGTGEFTLDFRLELTPGNYAAAGTLGFHADGAPVFCTLDTIQ